MTALLLLTAGLPTLAAESNELSFLNWADYMDPEILKEFK